MNKTETQTDASQLFCPTWECSARGKVGAGNIVSHGKKRERYTCKTCGKTFSAHRGTMLEGLRKAENLIVVVVTLLAYGCPRQAIVHAFGLDERTVARWQERAGQHCQKMHEVRLMQGKLHLEHVQAGRVPGERASDDPLDGDGDHGLHTAVEGRAWSASIGTASWLINCC
jgi:transposase-like protein